MQKANAYQATTGKWHGTMRSAVVDEVHTLLNPLGYNNINIRLDHPTAEYVVTKRKELIAILQQMDTPEVANVEVT